MCLPYTWYIFYMASPLLLVDHGAAATAVQKKACRAAAAYAAFAATTTTATAAASAVLLLSCCCAAAVVTCGYLFSVFLKKYDAAVLRDANRSFLFSSFDTRFVIFCDLMEFRRFAHRKHSQNDAGMNLAFFKFGGIIGLIVLSQTL